MPIPTKQRSHNRGRFWLSIHRGAASKTSVGAAPRFLRAHDVPLCALITRNVDGLLLAGRGISGDFIAHSSYRVTGSAAATGQAAGVAAALAADRNCLPHQIPWERMKATLATFDSALS